MFWGNLVQITDHDSSSTQCLQQYNTFRTKPTLIVIIVFYINRLYAKLNCTRHYQMQFVLTLPFPDLIPLNPHGHNRAASIAPRNILLGIPQASNLPTIVCLNLVARGYSRLRASYIIQASRWSPLKSSHYSGK